jgi:hypothetical protein
MWFLYLDESGDLGFDFSTKHPSRFFTVCILVVQGIEQNRRILAAVKKTIRRKLSRRVRPELKGTRTSLGVRTHFYEQIENVPFDIYALPAASSPAGSPRTAPHRPSPLDAEPWPAGG